MMLRPEIGENATVDVPVPPQRRVSREAAKKKKRREINAVAVATEQDYLPSG
jgi:hypothetical protein